MVDELGEALTHDRVVVDQVDAFLDHDGRRGGGIS
jgi:hypothetical protein